MKFTPHDYQTYTINEIINRKTIWLNLKMGLGKTVCTLMALKHWLDTGEVKKVLIIAPLRVCKFTWLDEIKKFEELSHLTTKLIIGTQKERIEALKTPAQIYIINQDNIAWLVEYSYTNKLPVDYDCLVIDESSNFKTYSSKRFKYLKQIALRLHHKILLTGTPMPNGYLDLWSQCYLLDGGLRLGKYITHYRATYFYPKITNNHGVVYEWGLKTGMADVIKDKIKDLVVSFDLDSIKMPERIDEIIPVSLGCNEEKMYRSFKRNYLLDCLPETVTASSAGVLTNKLLQFANGAVYTEEQTVAKIHDKKLQALYNLTQKHATDNLLVLYNYNHDRDRIKEIIPYARELVTDKDKEDWDNGDVRVLLAHPKSMGHGLNMQKGGHIVVWFSMTYDLALFEQANARLYRQGQNETVVIYYLLATNTIDEIAYKRLTDKGYTQEMYLKELMSSKN